jgi:uncharacterized protein (TIGR03067 family)
VCRVLLPLALVSLAFAPAPFPKAAKPTPAQADLRAMQGRWLRISGSFGGTELARVEANIRIVENKVAFYLGDRLRDEWSISLNPKQDTKQFDAKIISGDRKGDTVTGNYQQQGDVLTLSYTVTVRQGLLGTPEQALVVYTYRRKKP